MVLAGRPGRVTASRRGRAVTAVQSSSGRCHRHTRHTRHISTQISAHIYGYLHISTQLQLGVGCGLVSSSWRQCSGRSSSSSSLGGRASVAGASGWVAAEQRTADDCGKGHSNPHKHVQKQVRRRALGWAGAREVSIYTI